MKLFDSPLGPDTYAVIRFGTGYPAGKAPLTAAEMLDRLAAPDAAAHRFPKLAPPDLAAIGVAYTAARRDTKRDVADAAERLKAARLALRDATFGALAADLARMAETDDPFRERLALFWTNHFAIRATNPLWAATAASYPDHAIRPHLAGRFGDLLKAAVTHPDMLIYLDQTGSIGPNSPVGTRKKRGLNENLAREVLELHTLGVGAGYGQADVTEFAKLLTGLTYNIRRDPGMVFDPDWAEPGAETVLGRAYGGDGPARLADIHAALDDLAVHPATAAHLSGKLARHFVADDPDPSLLAAMQAAWQDTGGDLMAVYGAMLAHPAAWAGFGAKVKPPLDFLGSAVRALGLSGAQLVDTKAARIRDQFLRPLRAMGQDYAGPPGPDGFPDEARAWVQPFGMAQRIRWAMAAAQRVAARDPAGFAAHALGPAAGERLLWAVRRAETREQGVGLVLASAQFNRR